METLRLHLHSGVPVVTLLGVWEEATECRLTETIETLRSAGHLEVIVNLTHVTRLPYPERHWLDSLERLACGLRARFGRLEAVCAPAHRDLLQRWQAYSVLGWAISEEEAVCRIKGVPIGATGAALISARLGAESASERAFRPV